MKRTLAAVDPNYGSGEPAEFVGDDRTPADSASSLAVILLYARRSLRSRVVLGETA
jgi:hypothetical protein